jgi:hypothetical protein
MKIVKVIGFILLLAVIFSFNLKYSYKDYLCIVDDIQEVEEWQIKTTVFKQCPCCKDWLIFNKYGYLSQSIRIDKNFLVRCEILFCQKCLDSPDRLDHKKIKLNLKKENRWTKDEIDDIVDLVKEYKKKKFRLI